MHPVYCPHSTETTVITEREAWRKTKESNLETQSVSITVNFFDSNYRPVLRKSIDKVLLISYFSG